MRYRIWVITVILVGRVATSTALSKLTFASDYQIFFVRIIPISRSEMSIKQRFPTLTMFCLFCSFQKASALLATWRW